MINQASSPSPPAKRVHTENDEFNANVSMDEPSAEGSEYYGNLSTGDESNNSDLIRDLNQNVARREGSENRKEREKKQLSIHNYSNSSLSSNIDPGMPSSSPSN